MTASPRIIGLTGGIGTGKSTVARTLLDLGIPVVDADQLARDAVAKGSPILEQVIAHFGPEILDKLGHLDRRCLGRKVFSNLQERQWLEHQIHPYVRDRMLQQVNQLFHRAPENPVICLMIPLLFEAGMTDLVTEIWVVACSEHQQVQRLLDRDQLSWEEATDRIASQWPLQEKAQQADVLLDNSGSLSQLQSQIQRALGIEYAPSSE